MHMQTEKRECLHTYAYKEFGVMVYKVYISETGLRFETSMTGNCGKFTAK